MITFQEAAGVFMVQTVAPAGMRMGKHVHDKDHLSYLAAGTAKVYIDGTPHMMAGPCHVLVGAGKEHEIEAVTDIVWLCLWGSDEGMQELAKESLKLIEA